MRDAAGPHGEFLRSSIGDNVGVELIKTQKAISEMEQEDALAPHFLNQSCNSDVAEKYIMDEMRDLTTTGWENMPQEARDDLIRQMAIRRTDRLQKQLDVLDKIMREHIENFKVE